MRIAIIFLISFIQVLYGQNTEHKSLLCNFKQNAEIKLDGILNETVWDSLPSAESFWEKFPKVEPDSKPITKAKIFTDGEYLYLGFTCEQNFECVIPSLKRDQDFFSGDGIGVILDPYKIATTGYFFGVNPKGTQSDGLINSFSDILFNWDAPWQSATNLTQNTWSSEFKIPLNILKFKSDQSSWGINFTRSLTKLSKNQSWTEIPNQFKRTDLNYLGEISFLKIPDSKKITTSIIPYTLIQQDIINENNNFNESIKLRAGVNAKLGIGSSYNLDLTVNPDFSQIEVDEQVTNLSRFPVQYPEKRTFFLENADLFGSYGNGLIKPFISRRIGLDDNGEAVPIIGGARLTGNVNKRLRVGAFNINTIKHDQLPAQNYSAFTFYQGLFKKSRFKAIFLNRQALTNKNQFDYGRNAGFEFTYRSNDSRFVSYTGYNHSFKENVNSKNGSFLLGAFYSGNKWDYGFDGCSIGTNYFADLGYINHNVYYDFSRDTFIRKGYYYGGTYVSYKIYPKTNSFFSFMKFGLSNNTFLEDDYTFNENQYKIFNVIVLKDLSEFNIGATYNSTQLSYPYKFISDETASPLPIGKYQYPYYYTSYESSKKNNFNYKLNIGTGKFYNGNRQSLSGIIAYRFGSSGNMAVTYEREHINFPTDFGSGNFNKLAARIEINLSKKLFWTNFVQWVDQRKLFSVNSKIQWNFAKLSDIYLVYVDNYDTDILAKTFNDARKNYTLALKFNYWFFR